MKTTNKLFALGIVLLIAVVAFNSQAKEGAGIKAVVYKSATCGCCGGYVNELNAKGFDVEVITIDDMSSIKREHNIPANMESCHTTIIGDYFIEGHVPVDAVNKLLKEKPTIDGIALPGMPSGTPGMPGPKNEPWVIYSLIGESTTEFMVI